MSTLFTALGSRFGAASARFAVLGPPPIEPVPALDLKRYAGRWYQIGLMRNAFQAQGAHNVTATYTWNAAKQELDILNEAWLGDERTWIRGVAIRDPEARGDDVLARPEHVQDVGRADLDAPAVVGPARGHPVRADAPAVDRETVTERGQY